MHVNGPRQVFVEYCDSITATEPLKGRTYITTHSDKQLISLSLKFFRFR